MKHGNVTTLLIDPTLDRRYSATDRGIDWITDGYVLARADVFKLPPKTRRSLSTVQVRRVLDATRARPLLSGRPTVKDQMIRSFVSGHLLVLVGTPSLSAAFNERACQAWFLTDLKPRLNTAGQLLWFGKVRGKDALFGIVQPVVIP